MSKEKESEIITIDKSNELSSAASTITQQEHSATQSRMAWIQTKMAPGMIYVVSIAQFIDISKFIHTTLSSAMATSRACPCL